MCKNNAAISEHCLIPGYWLRFLLQEVKIAYNFIWNRKKQPVLTGLLFSSQMQENTPVTHSLHYREIRPEAGNYPETGFQSFNKESILSIPYRTEDCRKPDFRY